MGCTATTCPYCGVGCGVIATTDPQGGVAISGDESHPSNFGRLCSKGSALGETLDLDGRLLRPRIAGRDSDWDLALDMVADQFCKAIETHGPDSVAFYVSGQLLTEDYYVANKLMKGYIGSANIDTNSRLCMASSVAGHKRAFGSDTVPGTYEDLERADLIVLVGSNLAWCHPVLYQRIVVAKEARPELIVVNVDPRRTATGDLADLDLQIAPGSDVALFAGLLRAIRDEGAIARDYVADHVTGFDAAMEKVEIADLDWVAAETGLPKERLQAFFSIWIGTDKAVTVYSQGVNQSVQGTDKVNAILNCHLATGRIGREGMGPFSVTGQPNAMGGREVGGLSNMLACHLDIENEFHRDTVQDFWQSPTICTKPGLKAVDLYKACAEGRIKALWIMSTNPAVSMPEADFVRAAIQQVPFTVVSDILAKTDTTELADVLLPAAGWGEKSGTVTNSERRISRQRAFLPKPGQTRADWRIICDVAARMGWGEAFDYPNEAAIFREYAALSARAGALGRDFDISHLAGVSDAAYDDFAPVQWPVTNEKAGGRFFAEGGFYTPDRKGRMLPTAPATLAFRGSNRYPLRLNTGRVRDHWHTMTRTAKSARLSRHMAEPYIEIHPTDAARYGIEPAGLVDVSSAHGTITVRALVTDRTAPGSVFVPMHWTDQWASAGRVDTLVAAETDPISGQPDSKATAVCVTPAAFAWYGFAVGGSEPAARSEYWAKARLADGWQIELAGCAIPLSWSDYARSLFCLEETVEEVAMIDPQRGLARIGFLRDGRLIGAFYAAREPVAVARGHVTTSLGQTVETSDILAGRPGGQRPDPGAIVCACFDVGVNTILTAIEGQGLISVEEIGNALSAGTNCGSCRPELRGLLRRSQARAAAE